VVPETMPFVERISITPVRCFRLEHPGSVELTENGVAEDRRFVLADGADRRLRSSLTSWPMPLRAAYDVEREELRVTFSDGTQLAGSALGSGDPADVDFHGRFVACRAVDGPWNKRLAALAGHPVQLMRPEDHGEMRSSPVTLVSSASVERLAAEAGHGVDGRRFRMLFTLGGCRAHEEDEWTGRRVRIGDAVVRAGRPVDRCAMTTRDPDTGERDLDTLRLIKGYRGVSERKTIDFGIYGKVERPGTVRVGDTVEAL
jgi:MOSC domain-containing protein